MITAFDREMDNVLSTCDAGVLVEMIVNCLSVHIGTRLIYECNAYCEKNEGYDIEPEDALTRFTIMAFAGSVHEEMCIESFIEETRRAVNDIIQNTMKANKVYSLLRYTMEQFDGTCIMCLDGKPLKDGEFITIEEARHECNTIN